MSDPDDDAPLWAPTNLDEPTEVLGCLASSDEETEGECSSVTETLWNSQPAQMRRTILPMAR